MGFKFAHLWQGMDGMAKILRRKKYFMESRGAQTFWFFLAFYFGKVLFWPLSTFGGSHQSFPLLLQWKFEIYDKIFPVHVRNIAIWEVQVCPKSVNFNWFSDEFFNVYVLDCCVHLGLARRGPFVQTKLLALINKCNFTPPLPYHGCLGCFAHCGS